MVLPRIGSPEHNKQGHSGILSPKRAVNKPAWTNQQRASGSTWAPRQSLKASQECSSASRDPGRLRLTFLEARLLEPAMGLAQDGQTVQKEVFFMARLMAGQVPTSTQHTSSTQCSASCSHVGSVVTNPIYAPSGDTMQTQ
ncbi:hypothetical protein WJX74_003779, partial [Apatococcus lobatus]